MKYFDKGANIIFIHICKNIDFNSNVIKFTEKDIIDEYSISVETFYNGLNILYNFDVIKATTRKSVYIINHNIIFKGSIGDFIKEYNKYYENVDVIINDKTKVPISSIKSVLYSLKRKGFISNYKDKHNNNIKGCYVIK
mgnify:CR=1 FL=1|jgi:hypothetical protein